ncbi:MAG: hypothetical protein NC212_10435 [Staphylococcus sp.]|nr:hypothetical protein [Staphylococcus sp.]
MKNQKNTTVKNVSRKFYADICGRVADAATVVGGGETAADEMRIVVERYIADGTEPGADEDMSVRLVFAILRPEIDKALERSRMAKARAALRREAKAVGGIVKPSETPAPLFVELPVGVPERYEEEDCTPPETVQELTAAALEDWEPLAAVPVNRRQRRELERQRKRDARRGKAQKSNRPVGFYGNLPSGRLRK